MDNVEINEVSSEMLSLLASSKETKVLENIVTKHQKWLESRKGFITGSNFSKLVSMPKTKAEKEAGELGQTGKSYILGVVGNILGAPNKELKLPSFEWGKKYEPYAVEAVEKKLNVIVKNKNDDQKFLTMTDHIGLTPDGLINDDCGLEIKCPENHENHTKALLLESAEDLKKMNPLAYWQSLGGLLVTGRSSWYFCSYFHFFNDPYKLKLLKIKREEVKADLVILQNRLSAAVKYKELILNKLNGLNSK